jgi:hypothetical protein
VSHSKAEWYDSAPPRNEPRNPIIGKLPKEGTESPTEEIRRLREENERLRQQLVSGKPAETFYPADKCPACGATVSSDAVRCPSCQIALR